MYVHQRDCAWTPSVRWCVACDCCAGQARRRRGGGEGGDGGGVELAEADGGAAPAAGSPAARLARLEAQLALLRAHPMVRCVAYACTPSTHSSVACARCRASGYAPPGAPRRAPPTHYGRQRLRCQRCARIGCLYASLPVSLSPIGLFGSCVASSCCSPVAWRSVSRSVRASSVCPFGAGGCAWMRLCWGTSDRVRAVRAHVRM